MNCILHCLIWVILTSTTAYNCKQHNDFYYPDSLFGYPHYHEDDQEYRREAYIDYETFRPTPQTRRVDDDNYRRYYDQDSNERIGERSAEISNEPTQRMSERSISVNSNIQRVQEQERRRLQSRTEESLPRTENGSYKIVNHNHKPNPSVTNKRGQIEEDKQNFQGSVSFPEPTTNFSYNLEPEISDECERIGICDEVPNYPQDIVDRVVAELVDKRRMLNVDKMDHPIEIAQRFGTAENSTEQLCNFRVENYHPRAARDENGEWFFILNYNTTGIALQSYRIEICKSENSPCENNIATFAFGYSATCKQKYIEIRMLTLHKKTLKPKEHTFRVPCCCSCVVAQHGKK